MLLPTRFGLLFRLQARLEQTRRSAILRTLEFPLVSICSIPLGLLVVISLGERAVELLLIVLLVISLWERRVDPVVGLTL